MSPKFPSFRGWIRGGAYPAALLVISILAYGLLAPWLGFYWDDWPLVWLGRLFGPLSFVRLFSGDRPLAGWLYTFTHWVIPNTPFGWHIFAMLVRWLGVLALGWMLRLLWPKNPEQTAWATILFLVYPGFSQQSISVIYGHILLVLALFLTSLGFMLQDLRSTAAGTHPRWKALHPHLFLSLLTGGLSMLSMEYFFGLELLRPVMIWLALDMKGSPWQRRLTKTFLRWLPYILLSSIYLFLRFQVWGPPSSGIETINSLTAAPKTSLVKIIPTMLEDIFKVSWLAWEATWQNLYQLDLRAQAVQLTIGLTILSAFLIIFFLARFKPAQNNANLEDDPSWEKQAIGLGILALFAGGIPAWTTDHLVRLQFPDDRFTLAMMLGTSLVAAGLIQLLIRTRMQRVILIGLAAGLAIGMQFQVANTYRRVWNSQQSFFWQLAWRAPAIQPKTMLITDQIPSLLYYSDNSLSAPLNWIYDGNVNQEGVPYMLVYSSARLGNINMLPDLAPGLPVVKDYRTVLFTGNTSQSIIFRYAPPACLQIYDPTIHTKLPDLPEDVLRGMPLSRLDLISTNTRPPARPSVAWMGGEPEHTWCYYFEKADLARQQGNWAEVARLGDEAFNMGFSPLNPSEYIPFIEGYAMLGRLDQALQLTGQSAQIDKRMKDSLCETWIRVNKNKPIDPAIQDKAFIASRCK